MAQRALTPSSKVRHQILRVGNSHSMEMNLVERLKSGMIYAQAEKLVTTHDDGRTSIASPKGVEPEWWCKAADDPELMARMWKTGVLSLTVGKTNHHLIGIHLDEGQVSDLVARWATPGDEWTQINGGKPTAKWWSLFAVELARLVLEEGVPGDESEKNVGGVIAAVQERLKNAGVGRAPDPSSIRSTIHLLIERHKKAA